MINFIFLNFKVLTFTILLYTYTFIFEHQVKFIFFYTCIFRTKCTAVVRTLNFFCVLVARSPSSVKKVSSNM